MLDWGLRYAGRPRSPRDRVIYIGFPGPTQARHIDALAPFTCDHPLQCALVSSCGRSYDGALVIDAARLLHDAGNQCIRFTIIGDGEMKEAWMKRAAGLPNVEFTGFLNDDALSREMAGTHVGLIPMQGGITRFWMGNKIFEYLAGSLALASNLAGETAALIAKYDVGFSTPPGDAHALAASLARASDAPETVTKWMRNAGAAFRLHFERQTVYDTYVSYLRDIIADSRRQAAVNGTAS
jgi:glycosyltransferase involved in cell wall biosynthesis